MIEVAYNPSFTRAFRRIVASEIRRRKRFMSKLAAFQNDPFDKRLGTHKLSGKLTGLWSFSIEYDLRILFYFENSDRVVFIDVGTHDDVY